MKKTSKPTTKRGVSQKRDLPVPSVIAYFRTLAVQLNKQLELNEYEKLCKLYMEYADNVEEEERKQLVKYKKKSYYKGNKK